MFWYPTFELFWRNVFKGYLPTSCFLLAVPSGIVVHKVIWNYKSYESLHSLPACKGGTGGTNKWDFHAAVNRSAFSSLLIPTLLWFRGRGRPWRDKCLIHTGHTPAYPHGGLCLTHTGIPMQAVLLLSIGMQWLHGHTCCWHPCRVHDRKLPCPVCCHVFVKPNSFSSDALLHQ